MLEWSLDMLVSPDRLEIGMPKLFVAENLSTLAAITLFLRNQMIYPVSTSRLAFSVTLIPFTAPYPSQPSLSIFHPVPPPGSLPSLSHATYLLLATLFDIPLPYFEPPVLSTSQYPKLLISSYFIVLKSLVDSCQ